MIDNLRRGYKRAEAAHRWLAADLPKEALGCLVVAIKLLEAAEAELREQIKDEED